MKQYLNDFQSGATASITEHRDGTATLRISINGSRYSKKEYKSVKSAKAAWYRFCN